MVISIPFSGTSIRSLLAQGKHTSLQFSVYSYKFGDTNSFYTMVISIPFSGTQKLV
jgi:hypothetical protein